jgi:uncharacterized small protein (DUF1192 family)
MNKKEDYRAKQIGGSILDEIKSMDTSMCQPNSRVEKLLVYQIDELKERVIVCETELNAKATELNAKSKEISDLKVKVALHTERSSSDKIFTGIRSLIGITLGISAGLVFSQEALLSKIGLILSPIFTVLFLLTFMFRPLRGRPIIQKCQKKKDK